MAPPFQVNEIVREGNFSRRAVSFCLPGMGHVLLAPGLGVSVAPSISITSQLPLFFKDLLSVLSFHQRVRKGRLWMKVPERKRA
jgi:hypothetical protein